MPTSYTVLDPKNNQGFLLAVRNATEPTPAKTYPLAVKARDPKTVGKYYVEFQIANIGSAFLPLPAVGVAMLGAPLSFLGANAIKAAMLFSTGNVVVNTVSTGGITPAYHTGDVVSAAIDLDDGLIWFRVNGGHWNGSPANDPASNVGGLSLAPLTGTIVLAISNAGRNPDFSASLVSVPTSFSYTAPGPPFIAGWPDNEFPDPLATFVNGLGVPKLMAEAVIAPPGIAVRKMLGEVAIGAPGLAARKMTADAMLIAPGLAVRKLIAHAFLFSLDFETAGGSSSMPPIYPELIGLTYTVVKRPIWSTGKSRAGSGRTTRVGYFSVNLWEFELKYDFLPDKVGGTTPNDLKALEGFFLLPAVSGGLGGFLFDDTDDDTIAGQVIGNTDGINTTWTIVRQFAAGTAIEPVGMVDTTRTVTVYLNGVPQSASTYDIVASTPVNQQLRFHTAPATAGQVITMDFSFFFYVAFQDDKMDFVKFAEKLWQQDKIVLESLRG